MGAAAACCLLLAADTLPMADKGILSPQHYSFLCSTITTEEIRFSLFCMDDHKSPGIDGYNVLFFKRAWNIIGPDIVHDIQQFFDSGFLAKVMNCTCVTLVLKFQMRVM